MNFYEALDPFRFFRLWNIDQVPGDTLSYGFLFLASFTFFIKSGRRIHSTFFSSG